MKPIDNNNDYDNNYNNKPGHERPEKQTSTNKKTPE